MTVGDRFKEWISNTAASFANRLAQWFVDVASKIAGKAVDTQEAEIIDLTRELLTQIRENPAIPQAYKNIIDKALTTGDIGSVIVGWVFTVLGVIMSILSWGSVPARVVGYTQDRVSKTFRLDPMSVMTAWRRDSEKYNKYFDDLRDQGWDEDRIEALKFFTEALPTPQVIVSWLAREVFEPDMINKYGLDDEFGGLDLTLFDKIGVPRDQALNYWRAHWEHASWTQIVEMLRRGLITENDVYDWFRLVEIVPYWRDKLMVTSWEVPTRVDVRRFWDMRTIDEARLRQIYTAMGYHDQDLEDYVLWTKIYVDFPDLMTRFKNGWLTLDEVREELVRLGMSAERAEELIQTKVKAVAAEELGPEKLLTKTEIYKGVKAEVITWEQGVDLIMDLGYTEEQADYLLTINVAALAGSPESYSEFKEITTKWRKMVQPGAKTMPEELTKAADELVQITREIESLERSITEEERKLVGEEALPEEATARLNELRVSLHRAESEKQRLQQEYDRLVAEWKHGTAET